MNDNTDHDAKRDRANGSDRPDADCAVVPSIGERLVEVHQSISISCDDCSMRCTAACDDCVVTFLVGESDAAVPVVLDLDQARVVRLLGQAGLVPSLRHRPTG